jgi:hypothetical protein
MARLRGDANGSPRNFVALRVPPPSVVGYSFSAIAAFFAALCFSPTGVIL